MKRSYPIPTETARSQANAADPAFSAWVSANAGSGKTHVLAQRVIRLLLAGTDPSRILCLTYTRAAAANMANRVFSTLSQWTALPDEDLARRIEALEEEQRRLEQETGRGEFYQRDKAAITAALARLDELSRELARAYEQWERLESRKD